MEFIELVNPGDAPADISGWAFTDGVAYVFPLPTILQPGERLVVCRDRVAFAAAHGLEISRLHGDYGGALSNGGERVALSDPQGELMAEVTYSDETPFDPRADGTGPSLERLCFTADASLPGNWRASEVAGGTPLAPAAEEICPPPAPPVFSPVVINEIHYHPENDRDETEEFIELFNRSEEELDLHGWGFTGGVIHLFDRPSEATRIPAGGFLLLARNPAGLAAATGLPEASIAGPYAGKLSNFRDDLRLVDPAGRLQDRVVYSQDGLWPARADGLGASLQRISPEVSGFLPRNWSVTSDLSCAVVPDCVLLENGVNVRWFENIDGMDPGFSGDEDWFHPDFDDIANSWRDGRVAVGYDRRVPDGQPWVLTRSSSITGLHSILLRIEFTYDPDIGLCETDIPYLAADWDDGFIAWLNGDEITRRGMLDSPGTVPPFDGSYRAEIITAGGFRQPDPVYQPIWSGVAGSLRPGRNVLAVGNYNSRETSSDLYFTARLTLGPFAGSGAVTPAQVNSVTSPGVPPLVVAAEHVPGEPRSVDAVIIRAHVDGHDIGSVDLITDRGAGEVVISMRDDGQEGDEVAEDRIYSVRLDPVADGTLVKYRVEAGNAGGCTTSYPREGNPSRYTGFYVNDRRPEVNEDVRLFYIFTPRALRDLSCASGVRTPGTLVDWRGRAYFDVGVKFRGETACNNPKKTLRVRFNKGDLLNGQRNLNFNAGWQDKAMLREKLAFDFFADAGIAFCETHLARVHTNDGAFHGAYFTIEDPSDEYLRRNRWRTRGALYKCRTAMLSSSTSGYEPRTNSSVERLPEVRDFATNLNGLTGQALVEFLNTSMNVEGMIDYQAVQVIIIDGDSVVKNWLLYLGPHGRPESGPDLFTCFAWDTDLSYGQMYLFQDVRHDNIHPLFQTRTYPFVGQGYHGMVNALLERAPGDYYVKAYYGRMWSLLQEKFHPDVLLPGIERFCQNTLATVQLDLARWPRSWGSRTTDPDFWRRNLLRWVERRYDFLVDYLLGNNPTTNRRRFQYTPAPRIKISEIHYNPPGDENFEFLEFRNLEDEAIDLSGWSIPAIAYEFPVGSEAPPVGYFIVARSPGLFAAAYPRLPETVPVFGPYTGNLRNGGEEVRLRDDGRYEGRLYYPETIDVVRYDDDPPWPADADSEGPSLELIDLALDNDLPSSWQVSRFRGGSPGVLSITNRPPEVFLVVSPDSGLVPLSVHFDVSASFDPDGDSFTATWEFDDGLGVTALELSRTFEEAGTYGGTVTVDDGISPPVTETFVVHAFQGPTEVLFRRGDVNDDGVVDLSDAVRLLLGLFRGAPLGCRRAADVDDDGQPRINDAVMILNYLFHSGPSPAAPHRACGLDATTDGLECESYGGCP